MSAVRPLHRWLGDRRPVAPTRLAACLAMLLIAHDLSAQSRRPQPSARAARASAPAATADSVAESAFPLRLLVRPDTVTVAQPFSLVVAIDVPGTATVQWPTITDTAAVVAMRAAPRITTEQRGDLRRETAEYPLAAWDVGLLPLALPDIIVRTPLGVQKVSLRDARVRVNTVLPLDTSLHVPRPARDLFPRVVPWWEAWLPAAAVVAALGLLWWLWRRRRNRPVRRPPIVLDVYQRALHDFDRLQRLALADVGERGRAVALALEVVRTYVSVRVPAALLSRTSGELLDAVRDDARVPIDRLSALLAEADGIKFARRAVTVERARALHDESRAVVESVERAEQARRQLVDDERKAHERAERDARAQAEDQARRQSKRPKAGAA
jgi:hypothetical protein